MKTALILGGAACVHEDIKAALALFRPHLIVAVNDIGMTYPDIDHWVSYHPHKFAQWEKRRHRAGLTPPEAFWTHSLKTVPKEHRLINIRVLSQPHWGGSSGLLAVQVVLQDLMIEHSVLAGIPMTETRHFDPVRYKPWPEALYYRAKWEDNLVLLKKHVRSMSGWTREILGAPDPAWLGVEEMIT